VKVYRRWQQRIAKARSLLSSAPAKIETRQRPLPMIPNAIETGGRGEEVLSAEC